MKSKIGSLALRGWVSTDE